jgi:hypothetical protein
MWWAATSLDAWPDAGDNASGEVGKLLEEFDLSSRWGDRRQELVFIGIGLPRLSFLCVWPHVTAA